MDVVEQSEVFLHAAQSYRAKAVAQGFCDEAAEEMAVQFHERLISGLGGQ